MKVAADGEFPITISPDVLNTWWILDDAFEERCAILEYDAGYSRYQAEQYVAQVYGFDNKAALKKRVQELKANETQ